jgi:hypothetical protein
MVIFRRTFPLGLQTMGENGVMGHAADGRKSSFSVNRSTESSQELEAILTQP